MNLSDFDFDLPAELIAQLPLSERSASRLLVVDPNHNDPTLIDSRFSQLIDYLQTGDLLVFNNSRVIPARLYARKPSGGKIEILIERSLDDHRALCHIRSNKPLKLGQVLILSDESPATITARHANLFEVAFDASTPLLTRLQAIGHMPLPPYIKRADQLDDQRRYQTVYAKQPGSVAAPTAGLHFDQNLLTALKDKGIQQAFVTLHIGAGTFSPVRTEDIRQHTMHSEVAFLDEDTCQLIRETKARGHRVIAVGTTSLRVLESAYATGQLRPIQQDTNIFIYPGYRFQCVDALVTNFHLPQSTLFMLICAFCGTGLIKRAYQHAIDQRYRFFSYGDACLLIKNKGNVQTGDKGNRLVE